MLIGLLKKIAEKICYLIFAQKYLILKTIVKLEIIRNCLIKKNSFILNQNLLLPFSFWKWKWNLFWPIILFIFYLKLHLYEKILDVRINYCKNHKTCQIGTSKSYI